MVGLPIPPSPARPDKSRDEAIVVVVVLTVGLLFITPFLVLGLLGPPRWAHTLPGSTPIGTQMELGSPRKTCDPACRYVIPITAYSGPSATNVTVGDLGLRFENALDQQDTSGLAALEIQTTYGCPVADWDLITDSWTVGSGSGTAACPAPGGTHAQVVTGDAFVLIPIGNSTAAIEGIGDHLIVYGALPDFDGELGVGIP